MTKQTLLFLGDSITDCGHSADNLGNGFVSIIAKGFANQYDIINSGVLGNTTADVIKRFDKDVAKYNPDIVVLLIGTNDIWDKFKKNKPTTDQQFFANYQTIVDKILSLGSTLIILHPFVIDSVESAEDFKQYLAEWKTELNQKIAQINKFAPFAKVVIPLHQIFEQLQSSIDGNLLAQDGIHPTKQGHEVIALNVSKHL